MGTGFLSRSLMFAHKALMRSHKAQNSAKGELTGATFTPTRISLPVFLSCILRKGSNSQKPTKPLQDFKGLW